MSRFGIPAFGDNNREVTIARAGKQILFAAGSSQPSLPMVTWTEVA